MPTAILRPLLPVLAAMAWLPAVLAADASAPLAVPSLRDLWSGGPVMVRVTQRGGWIDAHVVDLPRSMTDTYAIGRGFHYLRGRFDGTQFVGQAHTRFAVEAAHCPRTEMWVPARLELIADGDKLVGYRREVVINPKTCEIVERGKSPISLVRISRRELPVEMNAARPDAGAPGA